MRCRFRESGLIFLCTELMIDLIIRLYLVLLRSWSIYLIVVFLTSGKLANCSNRRNYWLEWNLMHEMVSCDLQNLIYIKCFLVIRLMFWPMKWSWCSGMLWLNLLTPFLWSFCGIQGLSSEAFYALNVGNKTMKCNDMLLIFVVEKALKWDNFLVVKTVWNTFLSEHLDFDSIA